MVKYPYALFCFSRDDLDAALPLPPSGEFFATGQAPDSVAAGHAAHAFLSVLSVDDTDLVAEGDAAFLLPLSVT